MMTTVSDMIRAHRKAAGLTQAQLGERIGLPRERICTIESGRYLATFTTLERVAKGLGLTVLELLADDPKPPKGKRVRK